LFISVISPSTNTNMAIFVNIRIVQCDSMDTNHINDALH
jgi:hypothetical protein